MTPRYGASEKAANMLLHPFYGAGKGLKYPDADSSASVPITIRTHTTITQIDGTSGLYGGLTRVTPAPMIIQFPSASVNTAGNITAVGTSVDGRATDWNTYDANFRAYRVINFGVKVTYIGDSETDGGRYTIACHNYATQDSTPLYSGSTATWKKSGAIKDLKGLVVEPRRISIEALHYEPVGSNADEIAEFHDSWECFTIWVENTKGNPVALECVWNLECLPIGNDLSAAVATSALMDVPSLMTAVSNKGQQQDRAVTSSLFTNPGGYDFATEVAQAAKEYAVGEAARIVYRNIPQSIKPLVNDFVRGGPRFRSRRM